MVVLVVGLALWFFVSRASSRANEQGRVLLEALMDQQKRQNALLRRLCENKRTRKGGTHNGGKAGKEDEDIIRLVAER